MTFSRPALYLALFLIAAAGSVAGCNQSASETTAAQPAAQPAGKLASPDSGATKSAQVAAPAATPAAAQTAGIRADDARFKVPEGSAAELLDFIDQLANPAPFKNDTEAIAYQQQATAAIGVAVDRVLAGEVTERQAGDAIQWKIETLRVKGMLGDARAAETADKFLEQQAQDSRVEVKRAHARVRLRRDLAKWKSQDNDARLATLQEYAAAVKANGIALDDAMLLENISELCSKDLFVTSDAAAAPFRELLPLFRESSDPKVVESADYIEGAIRRLELPGNKLELEGKLLDGTPLDWDAYRGKVVLVDFWATDCEECLLETPNLARLYRMYKDKGFEILGVNLNRELDQVNLLVKESGMTWPSLFETHSDEERWSHPVADRLSIDGLPQMILVDQEGKVVHMNARGVKLGEELRKLLGEPAVSADAGITVDLPDGSVADILDYVENQIKTFAPPRSIEEQQQNRDKVRVLLSSAVEKILLGEPTVEQAANVVQFKIAALRFSDLSEAEGERELIQFLDRLEAHPRPAVAAAAAEIKMLRLVNDWDSATPAERAAVVDKYVALANVSGPSMNHVAIVDKLASTVALTGDEALAARAASGVLPLFTDRSDPQIAKAAEILDGTLRRMNLPGGQIELEGTFMDGKTLDWESYRGKVVLVDFWASWCGPCRLEIPNIIRNLNEYGDKGFEVLGICLDDNRQAAEEYIRQAGVIWPSLYGSTLAEIGFDHPVAKRYGITGVPLAILVDKEGKVVSMLARGPLLEIQLRQLLGESTPPANVD